MPSIEIKEKDLTTPGEISTDTEFVFIPGFSINDTTSFPGKNVPTPCHSLKEFQLYFGENPAEVDVIVEGEDEVATKTTCLDKSHIYASRLLEAGLGVLYMSINDPSKSDDEVSESRMYTALAGDMFDGTGDVVLSDLGEYSFKYLTSGGYPVFYTKYNSIGDDGAKSEPIELENAVADKMISLASDRGDCVALIDHPDSPDNSLTGSDSFYDKFTKLAGELSYGAAFTPWINLTQTVTDGSGKVTVEPVSMPPSFAYLLALATSIQTNPSWLAVAGASRGQIPGLYSDKPLNINKVLTNSIAEGTYQKRDKVSINAITNIKPFGYRIWGNRTLKDNTIQGELTATSFLNIRNMISDVKKVVYNACKRYTFEQDTDVLWINFKAAIEPTLNKMKTGAGLAGYKIVRNTADKKAQLSATIKLFPLYAVEDFEIEVQMLDEEVTVS